MSESHNFKSFYCQGTNKPHNWNLSVTTQRVLRVTPQTNEPCASVVYIRADTLPVVFNGDEVVGIVHSRLDVGTLTHHDEGEPTFTPDDVQPPFASRST